MRGTGANSATDLYLEFECSSEQKSTNLPGSVCAATAGGATGGCRCDGPDAAAAASRSAGTDMPGADQEPAAVSGCHIYTRGLSYSYCEEVPVQLQLLSA